MIARWAGFPQNVVDDDVDLAGRRPERSVGCVIVVGQRDNLVGSERSERVEPVQIAPSADHAPGAESFGDLDRHRSGVSGRTEDQDTLAGLDGDAAA